LFNIFKSNNIENLIEVLINVLENVPDNPMEQEWISVQSRGMKQWIAAKIAQNSGICANVNFIFPKQVIDHILGCYIFPGNYTFKEPHIDHDFLFWSAMKIIRQNRTDPRFSVLENYIQKDQTGLKLYQLSLKIAQLFDDYQIYRPSMLMQWQKQKDHHNLQDPLLKWQAALWNEMISKYPEDHIACAASRFLEKFSKENVETEKLPSRISFFGISYLPEVFLQIFEKISEIMDINLFFLSPSNQFFFDIKSEKQMGKIALKQKKQTEPEDLYYEITNPLLSSLGTAGKRFQSYLESFNYNEPHFAEELFCDPMDIDGSAQSMLGVLQSDILNLVYRKKRGMRSPLLVEPSDTSVSIHGCHSPMRETQILKDLLHDEFEKDPGLAPHDIIVMMPDIETYAPFIEAVFFLENSLPIAINDRKKRIDSEAIEAFLKIVVLKNSRFERREVLDLLLSESIARKFNIRLDELSMIEKMVEDARILWGRKSDHRESFNLPPFEENTWYFGMQRLFMGMSMPENPETPVQDILPCEVFEGLDLEVLGKFALFCDTLFSCLATFEKEKPVDKWCRDLKDVCNQLLDKNPENREDLNVLFTTVDQLKKECSRAEFNNRISFDVISAVMVHNLNQNISHGNFLSGNITFCNIMPMRSIPYKIVVLMGMDEHSFPRKVYTPGFNLIKKYPQPCDKIERDEDRYLFLETLLSARSKFIITYTGISMVDNLKTPCSGVVSELMDTMEQSFEFPKSENYRYHFFHHLHPFSRKYFIGDNGYFSFSKDNCSIAKKLSKDKERDYTFIEKRSFEKIRILPAESCENTRNEQTGKKEKPGSILPENSQGEVPDILLADIIRFFKNPVQWYMRECLGIKIPIIDESGTSYREEFSLVGLDQYVLGSFLVKKRSRHEDDKDYYSLFRSMGMLPLGMKGRLDYENTLMLAEPVTGAVKEAELIKQIPAVTGEVQFENATVSGIVSDISEKGAFSISYGKLNSSRIISAWIKHLFLNITAPENYKNRQCNTVVIGRDPYGRQEVLKYYFRALEPQKAFQYLNYLVTIHVIGVSLPLFFACETSWQLALILSQKKYSLDEKVIFKAMNSTKVQNSWYGGYAHKGEKSNPYISLYVKNCDPFKNIEQFIDSQFAQNSVNIWRPVIENLNI